MRKFVAIALVVVCALLVTSAPAFARGRGHGGHHGHHAHHGFHHGTVFVGVAPLIAFVPAYPYDWYPAPSYVYPPPPPPTYWYFCPSSGAHYPNVPSCPEPWVPVPAQ